MSETHHHHHLKTYEGYRLEGEPGAWIWVHPDGRREGPGAKDPPEAKDPPGDADPARQPSVPEQSSLFAGALLSRT